MSQSVFSKVIPNPEDYIGSDRPVRWDGRILVYVEGFDPRRSLRSQLIDDAAWLSSYEKAEDESARCNLFSQSVQRADDRRKALHNMYFELVELLKSKQDAAAYDFVIKQQAWPCFAVVATKEELERELTARYSFGRCEVDFGGIAAGDQMLLSIRMIPHEWRKVDDIVE
jgi:hypothetical protein